jgi:hypothetical protein
MSATVGRVEPRRIAVSLAMSSWMTESVINHAVPVSDHANDRSLTDCNFPSGGLFFSAGKACIGQRDIVRGR